MDKLATELMQYLYPYGTTLIQKKVEIFVDHASEESVKGLRHCKKCDKVSVYKRTWNNKSSGKVWWRCYKCLLAKSYESGRKRHLNNKSEYLKYVGDKCYCCGLSIEKEPLCCFDTHHVDPNTKAFNVGQVSSKWKDPDVREAIIAELKKCVLLCVMCHRKVTAKLISLVPDPGKAYTYA